MKEAQSTLRRFASFEVSGFRCFFVASLFLYGAINSLLLVRGFLVFDLTGSFTALGSIALAIVIPAFFATLYGGVIADRMSKTVLIAGGLSVMGLFALWIGLMLAFDHLRFWHVLLSSGVHGGMFGLISAAWYSVTPEIVPKTLVMNAVSWTMGGQNITRLVIPAVFGYVLSLTDIHTAYFLMSGLFFISAALMLRVKLAPLADQEQGQSEGRGEKRGEKCGGECKEKRHKQQDEQQNEAAEQSTNTLGAFAEGIKYTRKQPAIAALVLSNILLSGLSLPFLMLLPGYVKDALQSGPETLGLMVSVTSVGALAATYVLTTMPAVRRGVWFLCAGILTGSSLLVVVAAGGYWWAYSPLIAIGAGLALRQSMSSSLCQIYVSSAYRGRVGSLISMQMTAGQVGTFLFGRLADLSSIQQAFAVMGVMLLAVSCLFLIVSGPLRDMQ